MLSSIGPPKHAFEAAVKRVCYTALVIAQWATS